MALGTFFNSNSEVERAFSVETDINRDPKKNRMGQELLEAHMQIRYGVESPLNYDKNLCHQCLNSRKRPHCHCSYAVVNDDMLNRFKKAYLTEDKEEEVEVVNSEESQATLKAEESKRISVLKQSMLARKTFYPPNLMGEVCLPSPEQKSSSKKSPCTDTGSSKQGSKKEFTIP